MFALGVFDRKDFRTMTTDCVSKKMQIPSLCRLCVPTGRLLFNSAFSPAGLLPAWKWCGKAIVLKLINRKRFRWRLKSVGWFLRHRARSLWLLWWWRGELWNLSQQQWVLFPMRFLRHRARSLRLSHHHPSCTTCGWHVVKNCCVASFVAMQLVAN